MATEDATRLIGDLKILSQDSDGEKRGRGAHGRTFINLYLTVPVDTWKILRICAGINLSIHPSGPFSSFTELDYLFAL
jgi:hypothetical protein